MLYILLHITGMAYNIQIQIPNFTFRMICIKIGIFVKCA